MVDEIPAAHTRKTIKLSSIIIEAKNEGTQPFNPDFRELRSAISVGGR
jgi:hypothetical protein